MSELNTYFRREVRDGEELFHPLRGSHSGWNPRHLRGAAVTSLLARAAERSAAGHTDVRPARTAFELFRPARRTIATTRARVVRHGRRLLLVDSELVQGDEVVARASTLFLAPGPAPEGRLWTPEPKEAAPSPAVGIDGFNRAYRSEDEWTGDANEHENARRKCLWQVAQTPVEDENPSPFQIAAAAADMSNLAVHWGDRGIEYINADVTLTMARLPLGGDIGIAAMHRVAESGIGVGASMLFDRTGVFAYAAVTSLANAEHAVRPSDVVG